MMEPANLQRWLGAHAQPVKVDGQIGPITVAALGEAFRRFDAPAMPPGMMAVFADRLGCNPRQIAAVAQVESRGSGYRPDGLPTILFERHIFHRRTGGRFPTSGINSKRPGGYGSTREQWDRLLTAARLDPTAAFESASWGMFQVMGMHWQHLGYRSVFDMAYACVTGQAAHFDMLARFIEANGLKAYLMMLSDNPLSNIPFSERYNGRGFRKNEYHIKLASAMK